MTARIIEGDEHYGQVGFGTIAASAVNVFTRARFPDIAEPTIIIKDTIKGSNALNIVIRDILVWDLASWDVFTSATPDIVSAGDTAQETKAGITKDNSAVGNQGPTSDIIAQGTFPGGNGGSVNSTGSTMNGQTAPRFEALFSTGLNTNETVDATGQANHSQWQRLMHKIPESYPQYVVDGNTFFHLLTAAHYHLWVDSNDLQVLAEVSVGGRARRVSVGLREVMFDREVLFSILEALEALT